MEPEPEPRLCPECGAPAVRRLRFAVTASTGGDFVDDEGRAHFHDPNNSAIGFQCPAGHSWTLPSSCWCGWRGH